jgi:hypothetical protein
MAGTQDGAAWPPRRMRLTWACFAVLWIVMLAPHAVALVRGQRDTYHNEHWRGATIAGGSLLLALSNVTTNRHVQHVLLGVSFAVLAWSVWLIR